MKGDAGAFAVHIPRFGQRRDRPRIQIAFKQAIEHLGTSCAMPRSSLRSVLIGLVASDTRTWKDQIRPMIELVVGVSISAGIEPMRSGRSTHHATVPVR